MKKTIFALAILLAPFLLAAQKNNNKTSNKQQKQTKQKTKLEELELDLPEKPNAKKNTSIYESLKLNLPKEDDLYESLKLKLDEMVSYLYVVPEDDTALIWHNAFVQDQILEKAAKKINSLFKLERKLDLVAGRCRTSNAFYIPDLQQIRICYDLLIDMMSNVQTKVTNETEAGEQVGNAFLFILFHEIGHAMIDLLDIPVAGKGEDAADFFAFYMLGASGNDQGAAICIAGANFFRDAHEAAKNTEDFKKANAAGQIYDSLIYWDEHSFSMQRYYSLLGLVYGSNPERWKGIIVLEKDHEERAEKEYADLVKSWDKLLKPHLK